MKVQTFLYTLSRLCEEIFKKIVRLASEIYKKALKVQILNEAALIKVVRKRVKIKNTEEDVASCCCFFVPLLYKYS